MANVIAMFSTDLVKLIVVANFFAIPAAYYSISVSLDNYAYKTPLGWWVFVVPAAIILVLAVTTVSAQTLKVAAENPVEGLKCE